MTRFPTVVNFIKCISLAATAAFTMRRQCLKHCTLKCRGTKAAGATAFGSTPPSLPVATTTVIEYRLVARQQLSAAHLARHGIAVGRALGCGKFDVPDQTCAVRTYFEAPRPEGVRTMGCVGMLRSLLGPTLAATGFKLVAQRLQSLRDRASIS
jgi:hypothetical protein